METEEEGDASDGARSGICAMLLGGMRIEQQVEGTGEIMVRLQLLLLILFLFVLPSSASLSTSQIQSLLRLPKLLGYPSSLSQLQSASASTDFCSIPSSPSLSLSCNPSRTSLLELQIVGNGGRLTPAFSMETLANTLSQFPDLQALILARCGLWGAFPAKLDHLPRLQDLNLSSNFISGHIPLRIRALRALQSLNLGGNQLTGSIPGFISAFPALRELDLSHNSFSGVIPPQIFTAAIQRLDISHNAITGGLPPAMSFAAALDYFNAGANKLNASRFPTSLPPKIQFLLIGQNEMQGPIPVKSILSLRRLRVLDMAYNRFSGQPAPQLFNLSTLEVLAINGNELSGELPSNLTLSASLRSVDVSSNFFTGRLPSAFLRKQGDVRLRYEKNCFSTRVQRQYVVAHCRRKLEMASKLDHDRGGKAAVSSDSHDMELISGIVAGGVALLAAVAVFCCVLIRCLRQQKIEEKQAAQYAPSSCADTASIGVPSDLLTNARYLSQSLRLGVLGPPHNRVFSVPELEEATGNFSVRTVIGEGEHGKVYRGKLQDGTVVAVKCLNLDPRQDLRQLKAHVELLVKVRHRHLVSYYGYCIDRGSETSRARLFLVSEFIDNGTLRSHISRRSCSNELLSWPQRLAAVIAAGRGIQFLHTGVVPGIFNNDVVITNILMDQNYVARFTDYGLGRHARTSCDSEEKLYLPKSAAHIDLDHHRRKLASDKTDVHNFGFVLLEIVLGRAPTVDEKTGRIRELDMLMVENVSRLEVIDSFMAGTCVAESLTTVLEIASKCCSADVGTRPSMEDVLWNLQYAAQVQDRVSGEYSQELPYFSPPRSRFNRQAIRAESRQSSSSGGGAAAAGDR